MQSFNEQSALFNSYFYDYKGIYWVEYNNVSVDGYQNFIFINRFGGVLHTRVA